MEPPILRLLAPNPGPWTGTGTNTWLIGAERLVLVDPGPEIEAHAAAILAAVAGRPVEAVIVTHAHRDHCGLARSLADRLRAPVLAAAEPLGRPPRAGETPGPGVDLAFRPDIPLVDGADLAFCELRLTPWATPGHLGGHVCLQLEDLLFSGDHVMGWSTSVVTPPEGDMAAYRASLARLAGRGWRCFLPGHGPEIADPAARLAELIAHRATREAQVLEALGDAPRAVPDLARSIYAGLAPALQAAAEGNVLAHLLELEARGRVERRPSGGWRRGAT